MITVILFISVVTLNIMMFTINPVKMVTLLMILSSGYFFVMVEITGSSWFSLVFYLLFMGGILIMFMILSSLAPNEKSLKIKTTMMLTPTMILMIPTASSFQNNMEMIIQMKWFMKSNYNLQMTILIMMCYFLVFTYLTKSENSPLRATCCQ